MKLSKKQVCQRTERWFGNILAFCLCGYGIWCMFQISWQEALFYLIPATVVGLLIWIWLEKFDKPTDTTMFCDVVNDKKRFAPSAWFGVFLSVALTVMLSLGMLTGYILFDDAFLMFKDKETRHQIVESTIAKEMGRK